MFLWIWFIITNHTAKESIKVLSYWYYDKDTTSSKICNLNQKSPLTTKRHIWRKKTKHHLEYILFCCHVIPGIIMCFTFITTMNFPNYVLSNTLYRSGQMRFREFKQLAQGYSWSGIFTKLFLLCNSLPIHCLFHY